MMLSCHSEFKGIIIKELNSTDDVSEILLPTSLSMKILQTDIFLA